MTVTTPQVDSGNTTARFGTFAGVFTPNVLTILGIILFLRMGEVVGQAGLWNALLIIAIANAISLMTGLSLSAIATNMTVRAGGNYYIISRSLGLEIGGAIGIPLFLSQAISVAFYIIGFTEAARTVEFFAAIDPRLIATVVAILFVVIAYIGADFALKIQFFILAILAAAIVSFFTGGWNTGGELVLQPEFREGSGFWVVFALFFPAVTGIEVGVSLSGDLKDPSKSIPRGTIISIIFTAIVYMMVAVWLSFNLDRQELLTNNLAMQEVASIPILILAGVWASTLSSALGSVLAAPRTLQAIARDRIVPEWISWQLGSKTEPRMAVIITGGIAVAIIWAGDLDFVAPIITMFFLNTYGMVNLVASMERLVQNPSFRPRFRIPWYVSLVGALGCYGAMFLISPPATIVAIVVSYGFFLYLERREIERTWGDLRSGVWFTLSRYALLRLDSMSLGLKNWRPNIIVFTGQPHNRAELATVAQWLSLGRGIVTFFQLIPGNINDANIAHLRDVAKRGIKKYIDDMGVSAFAEAEVVENFRQGAVTIVQTHGIGYLEANAVMFGWSRTADGRQAQMGLLRDLNKLGKSVLFLNYDDEHGFGERKQINVWWQGRGGNEDLMLILAYIISGHPTWKSSQIRIIRVVNSTAGVAEVRKHTENLLDSVRVPAEPVIIVRPDRNEKLVDIIRRNSRHADLTILGMHLPSEEEDASYGDRINSLVEAVGTVLLVRNAQGDRELLTAE
jgi:amino acid transporter